MIKRFPLYAATFIGLALAGVVHGQQSAAPPATPVARRPIRIAAEGKALRDLPYVTNGHERQRLDLYLPKEGGQPWPLIVWIHGGGWERGDKSNPPARAMVIRGFAVASIEYRLSQHAVYPAQIEDCKAAIRWLRANAKEHGIDPERIGVWGASAGGHLAALLGTTGDIRDFDVGENLDQPSAVQCVLDWFGPADFLNYGDPPWKGLDYPRSVVSKLLGGTISGNRELARKASPVYFAKASAPPFLIMQGDQDDLVPLQQSELLHDALKRAGARSELIVLPGAGHGGPAFISTEMRERMVNFFFRYLGRVLP